MDKRYKLPQKIIELSDSKDWDNAKREWEVESYYYTGEPQECECGHYPIYNICLIRNKVNKKTLEVGCVCGKKFLDIDDGKKILDSAKKLSDNQINKSISKEALKYLHNNKHIKDNSYRFYLDIIRKRNLSVKQMDWKININKIFLDKISYEANHIHERIEKALNWVKDNSDPENETKLISIKSDFQIKRYLSEEQKLDLNSIITRFKIK